MDAMIAPSFRHRPRPALRILLVTVTFAVASVLLPAAASATAATPDQGSWPDRAGRPAWPTARGTRTPVKPPMSRAGVENWTGPSTTFHPFTTSTGMTIVQTPGAIDGKALKLQLNAYPEAGAGGGAVITSNTLYRYGSFGTRMRTADCSGQDHPGVVTGTFTYAPGHSDANDNGVSDNDEIDIEFLCAQPDVVYLSIWTDYSETGNSLRKISRAINLRTGKVLSTCYLVAYGSACLPILPGENSPTGVPPIPGFNSATQFATYSFDWQPDHVTFNAYDGSGRKLLLWDYRGPRSRIPGQPSSLMQNVTHTKTWDPLNGPAHNQPTADTSAYIDTTFAPS
jgi:Glycosyl hydrolases family 16